MPTGYPEILVHVKPENMPLFQTICLILVKRHRYQEEGDPVPFFLQIVICCAVFARILISAMKAGDSRLLHGNLLR
jgi:hypothetical protein